MTDDSYYNLIDLYGDYKDRLLPYTGGALEQPAAYTEAMRFIGAYIEHGE